MDLESSSAEMMILTLTAQRARLSYSRALAKDSVVSLSQQILAGESMSSSAMLRDSSLHDSESAAGFTPRILQDADREPAAINFVAAVLANTTRHFALNGAFLPTLRTLGEPNRNFKTKSRLGARKASSSY